MTAGEFFNGPRVHWMRNALAYVPKGQRTPRAALAARCSADEPRLCLGPVAAALRQAFLQPDQESAWRVWRQTADRFRARRPKLGTLMDEGEHDVLAEMGFPTP